MKKILSVTVCLFLLFNMLPIGCSKVNAVEKNIIWLKGNYTEVNSFSEGLAQVNRNHVYGYIDKTGKEVIPLNYTNSRVVDRSFNDGLALVGNNKYGYIDKTGKHIIPVIYDDANAFKEGVAPVSKNGKYGYIDVDGREVIPFSFSHGWQFNERVAFIGDGSKVSFIDSTGRVISPFKYEYGYKFEEGLAPVIKNGKYGYIDVNGREVIPFSYSKASHFSEGLAMVRTADVRGVFEVSYIDKTGKEVMSFKYDDADSFYEGMARVKNNSKWGFINSNGKEAISLNYDMAWNFSEGLAPVSINGKWGFIDKTGKEIIPLIYDNAKPFSEGVAIVKLNNKWGILNNPLTTSSTNSTTIQQTKSNIATGHIQAYFEYLMQFARNNVTTNGYEVHGKNAVLLDISGNGIPELVTFDFYNGNYEGANTEVLTSSNNEVINLGKYLYNAERIDEIYLAEDNYSGNKFILVSTFGGGTGSQYEYVSILKVNDNKIVDEIKFGNEWNRGDWIENNGWGEGSTYFWVDGNWNDGTMVESDDYYKRLEDFNNSITKTPIKPLLLTESKIREILGADIEGQIQNLDLSKLKLVEGSRTFLDLNISGPNIRFEYKINDPSIATIRSNGEIIGLREGETLITVTIRHGNRVNEIEIPLSVKPKVDFDYKSIITTQDRGRLLEILRNTISSLDDFYLEDNSTLMELVNFSNFMIKNASRGRLNARNNVSIIGADNLKPLVNNVQSIVNDIKNLFSTNNINIQRQLTSTVRFDVNKLKSNNPVHVILNNSILEELNNVDAIEVGLDFAEITVNTQALNVELGNRKELRVELRRKKDSNGFVYEILFSDENGQAIPRLERNLTLSLPVQDMNPQYSTVFMNDGTRTEQLGGQYDPNTNMISFQTRATGEYYILENKTDFKDISHLTEEEQQAIIFMTTRGFIGGRDEENFEPNAEITRGEFTSLLVRTFYALDRSLTPSFTDITKDDWYYDYVASSEKERIVSGYPDGTFRGVNIVTREESVSIATRALHEKKKYLYPENPENYLPFLDSHEIQEWAKGEIALAYRETLIDLPENGMFGPQAAMTRAEAVLLIHRLFQLLYETTPTALPVAGSGTSPLSGPIPIAGGVAGIGALGGILYKKRFFVKKG